MTTTTPFARQIAESLLSIGAVTLSPKKPFVWTSGLKSPIYCDNRLTLSYPQIRRLIRDGFVSLIREHYPEAQVIAGTATAGIPHAAWVAEKLELPMIYVRDKAKGHGKQNRIEGILKPGQKAIVIEDLISTGGSSLKAAEAIQQSGGEVLAVLAIFTYQMDQAAAAFQEKKIPLHTLSDYSVLLETAVAQGYIKEGELQLLRLWRQNPHEFAKKVESGTV